MTIGSGWRLPRGAANPAGKTELTSLPKLSRPKQILLDFFLVFLFAAMPIRPYFKAKYTDKWASIESTFIGDARFLYDHWPHPQWQPLWYADTRFDYIYPPALRYGTAAISKLHRLLAGEGLPFLHGPLLRHRDRRRSSLGISGAWLQHGFGAPDAGFEPLPAAVDSRPEHAAVAHGGHRRSAEYAGARVSFARHRGRAAVAAGGKPTQRLLRV